MTPLDLFDEIETSSKTGDVFEGDLFDELTQKEAEIGRAHV